MSDLTPGSSGSGTCASPTWSSRPASRPPEHARNHAISSYKHACWLDGIEPPPDEVIAAELDRRRGEEAGAA